MLDIRKAFDKRLRELQKEKGLAQDKLAVKAGLNPSYVGFIDRAERNPTSETIYKLSSALDIHIKICSSSESLLRIPLLMKQPSIAQTLGALLSKKGKHSVLNLR